MAMRKRHKLIAILAGTIAAFLLLLGVVGYRFSIEKQKAAEESSKTSPTPPTGAFRPTRDQWASLGLEAVRTVSFRPEEITDGIIATNDNTTVSIFSPFSGRVSKLYAKLGDVLKKGAPLMAVEASEFVQGQNDLVAALAVLNTARTQAGLAEKTENRQHELYLAKAGALKDWLQSQSDLTAAKNNVRSAEIALGAVRNRLRILGKTDDEILQLETEPNAFGVKAESVVKAPIAGTVVQRQIGLGQYIQSASGGATTPVFSISDLSSVWLVANLRETDAPSVRVGQAVEVKTLAYPERVFKAKVEWISPSVDPNTHRIPVRAQIENRDGVLKPQMFASFSIFTGDAATVLAIPRSAIIYEGNSAHVFVANDDGTLRTRTIEVGRQSGDLAQITKGLSNGEKVVTSGALFIDRAAKGSAA